MNPKPQIKMYSFTLDCKEPRMLAAFYAELLGWEVVPIPDEEYVIIAPPGTAQGAYPGVTFQRNPDYIPPVWPDDEREQRQMAHLDFVVDDMDGAVRHALMCGAVLSERQFSDGWRVMFDPAGHPFCLCDGRTLFGTADFALK